MKDLRDPNAVALGRKGGIKKSTRKTLAARANLRIRWEKYRAEKAMKSGT